MQSLMGGTGWGPGREIGGAPGHVRVTPLFVGGHPGNANSWVMYLREHFCPLKLGFV